MSDPTLRPEKKFKGKKVTECLLEFESPYLERFQWMKKAMDTRYPEFKGCAEAHEAYLACATRSKGKVKEMCQEEHKAFMTCLTTYFDFQKEFGRALRTNRTKRILFPRYFRRETTAHAENPLNGRTKGGRYGPWEQSSDRPLPTTFYSYAYAT